MLNQSYDQLLEQQKNQLSNINANISDPLEQLKFSIDLIQKNLKELKEGIRKQPFSDQKEEIYFFKKIKPALYSDKILVDIPTKVRQCSATKYPIYSGAKYATETGE